MYTETMERGKIIITPIELGEKPTVWRLLQQYLDELSKFGKHEKNADGEYVYEYFDSYWQDKERFPFYIMIDKKIAGFIFVNNHSVLSKDKNLHSIGEFYVLPQFRTHGIGKTAAIKVFSKFPGKWEVAQLFGNDKAIKFWRKVISEYTKGIYREEKNSFGPVQIFNSIEITNN